MELVNRLLGRYVTASVSETGLVRDENQDAVLVSPALCLYGVSDGMGGGASGALASRIIREEVDLCATDDEDFTQRIQHVDAALVRANARIRDIIRNRDYAAMGATVAVMLFDQARHPREVAIGHVGDSRVYCRRHSKITPLTNDHRKSVYSHLLTRSIGMSDALEVEWQRETVREGDVWLVCTDGVHDMLPDSTINGLLAQGGGVKERASRLSAAVMKAGARDNFTFCLVCT